MSSSQKLNQLSAFSDLLNKLYSGAEESDPWQGFLTSLKNILDLQYATLLLRPPSSKDRGLLYTAGDNTQATLMAGTNNIYTEHYYALDPLVDLPINTVVTLGETIPQHKLESTEYYRLFLKPFSIAYSAGLDLEDEQGKRFCLRLSRSHQQSDFTKGEKRYIELLIPHLRRTVIQRKKIDQLNTERQVYAHSISKRSIGVVNLNKEGQIIDLNRAAHTLFEDGDGITQSEGVIRIDGKTLNQKLQNYIHEIIECQRSSTRPPINAVSVPRPSGKPDYELVLKPLPVDRQRETANTPRLILFIQAPETDMAISVRLLIHLYGLTGAEASLAIILADGNTIDEAATQLGIKKNTARSHLRAIFAKTGVTQQSILVSLVLKSLASAT